MQDLGTPEAHFGQHCEIELTQRFCIRNSPFGGWGGSWRGLCGRGRRRGRGDRWRRWLGARRRHPRNQEAQNGGNSERPRIIECSSASILQAFVYPPLPLSAPTATASTAAVSTGGFDDDGYFLAGALAGVFAVAGFTLDIGGRHLIGDRDFDPTFTSAGTLLLASRAISHLSEPFWTTSI